MSCSKMGPFSIHNSLRCAHAVMVGATCDMMECPCRCHHTAWPLIDMMEKLLNIKNSRPSKKNYGPPSY